MPRACVSSFAALGGLLLALRAGGAGDRLGLPAAIAGRRRAARLHAVRDGSEPVRGRRFRRRRWRGVGSRLRRAHAGWPAPSRPACWRRSSRPRAPRRSWAPRSALRCSPPPVDGACRLCRARRRPRRAGRAGDRDSGIARLLPRPGPWMLWFKQLLAFPLYAHGRLAGLGADAGGRARRRRFSRCSAWCWSASRCGSMAARASPRRPGGGSAPALAAAGLAAALLLAATADARRRRPPHPARGARRRPRLRAASAPPGSTGSWPSERRSSSI